jgi:flagellar motor switch protein FliM
MSELLSLQPGDIITTEKKTSADAFVEVEGKQKFRGQVGQLRGKRAIRITAVTTERAEQTADGFGARR